MNRRTSSGLAATPDQRAGRLDALKATTLEAAYSIHLENESPGKLANFAVLGGKPLSVEAGTIKDIPVWGTMYEGGVLPAAS